MTKLLWLVLLLINSSLFAQNGRVGINTTVPQDMLHVKDSSVVFTGALTLPATPGNPPVTGAGARMMWYPDKAAFRVGSIYLTEWNKDSIGNYSFASGRNTKAKGTASTAMGLSTNATGNNSNALGQNTFASGLSSTAMGWSAHSEGSFSTAMGLVTYANAFASLTIGSYNDSISGSNPTSWVNNDPLFIVGNGTSNTNARNTFTILKNSYTGINVSNSRPQALLHLKGSLPASFDSHIRLESAGASTDYANIVYDGSMKFRTFGTDDEYQWRTFDNTTRMTLGQTGNLTIGGTLAQNSDSRLKKI